MHLAASRGLSGEFVDILREHRERGSPGENDPVRRIMRGERVIQILYDVDGHRHAPIYTAAAELGSVRSIIFVALVKADRLRGKAFEQCDLFVGEGTPLVPRNRKSPQASGIDLVPVFDAILEKARAVCGFAHGSLNVYDGEYFRTVAMHGYPEGFAEVLRQPRRTGPQARFLEGDRIVHITDVAQGSGPMIRSIAPR
jgi:hypothetical protein